jgi:hypothetical protein
MKTQILVLSFFISSFALAQSAVVDVSLTPAGSFKIKTADVRGFAHSNGDTIEAKGISVGLKNIQTGITLRDTHTKKHLEVDKYPDAVLLQASGKGGKGSGVIKIKGIEKKIAGTYKIEGHQVIAKFPLKLSDFNINDIKYMGVGVDDEVSLTVAIPIQK